MNLPTAHPKSDPEPGRDEGIREESQKLFGRNVSARGSILSVYGELWFFPSQIQLS